ncbi:MAG: DUF975 family protein [Syntrophomonadaceae bacterium]|nr:DUF975 family protein [Syntrophomonadaceae bacterium]
MWTRQDIKSKAWENLRSSYWKAFLVSLVIAIVGGNGGSGFNFNTGSSSSSGFPGGGGGDAFSPELIAVIIVAVCIGMLIFLAFRIFIGYPLEVGGRKYFIEAEQFRYDMNHLGYIFNKAYYLDVIKSMLWRAFINFLWYLLLIIPGIIATYAYRMVPYILAENPNIGYKRALELSAQMTKGHKWGIFVLDLSFIGWMILGILALLIGVLFVFPYINATNAELYLILRQQALDNSLCIQEELSLASTGEVL